MDPKFSDSAYRITEIYKRIDEGKSFDDMTDKEIESTYQKIMKIWEKHLKPQGVKKVILKKGEKYNQMGLALTYIFRNYDFTKNSMDEEVEPVTKKELTDFVRSKGIVSNDVQAGRQLKQKGWFIISRKKGIYNGVSLLKSFSKNIIKRKITLTKKEWADIKKASGNKCKTCGAKEGDEGIFGTIVNLEMAHKDPNKPLSKSNVIPQCQVCNKIAKSDYIFSDEGQIDVINSPDKLKKSIKHIIDAKVMTKKQMIDFINSIKEIKILNKVWKKFKEKISSFFISGKISKKELINYIKGL